MDFSAKNDRTKFIATIMFDGYLRLYFVQSSLNFYRAVLTPSYSQSIRHNRKFKPTCQLLS